MIRKSVILAVLAVAFAMLPVSALDKEPGTCPEDSKVSCTNPHTACSESEVVLETLKKIARAYTEGNFDEFEKYLDEGVTTFDGHSKKLLVGRAAVMDDLKKRWHDAHVGKNPVLSYTIDHPYARVDGDTAVVTFHATKVVGGRKTGTYESDCTDVFVRKNGIWKKLHYKSDWKKKHS